MIKYFEHKLFHLNPLPPNKKAKSPPKATRLMLKTVCIIATLAKAGLLICLVITEKYYSEILSRMRSAEQEMFHNGS
jgi:hypothetical protein